MIIQKRRILVGTFLMLSAGCSSLTTPVLTHETGEALGTGKIRARASLETSRLFPLIPASVQSTATPTQSSGIFRGGFLGLNGAVGVTPKWDLQLGTYFSLGGAGWRFGTKYQVLQRGGFAGAVMLGYGRFSAKGTESVSTTTGPVDVTQTLSAYNFSISLPVSYRIIKPLAVYSGLNYYRSGLTGSADLNYVSHVANDVGLNFGVKMEFGRFEGDAEIALVRLYDPISNGMELVPYWGVSWGIVF